MSAIDEGIVREYFEQNGFLVRQVRKYQVQSRKKQSEEEIDLVVAVDTSGNAVATIVRTAAEAGERGSGHPPIMAPARAGGDALPP